MENEPHPPSEPPPPEGDLSGHYRRDFGPAPGSADRLQALADGYFGLNWVFLANVLLAIGLRVAVAFAADERLGIVILFGAIAILLAAVAILS